jgi:hypothetical protein
MMQSASCLRHLLPRNYCRSVDMATYTDIQQSVLGYQYASAHIDVSTCFRRLNRDAHTENKLAVEAKEAGTRGKGMPSQEFAQLGKTLILLRRFLSECSPCSILCFIHR